MNRGAGATGRLLKLVYNAGMGGVKEAGSSARQRLGGPRLTCIDLFAGAGGLADGFRQAGWTILAAVDSDPHAAETFRHNFPDAVFIEDDVGTVAPEMLLEATGLAPGELDCLAGGPPCQSFSYNNHARSSSGRRAKLFRHYLRIVGALKPKTLLMENVPGMLTIGGGSIVGEIRKSLAKLGYEVGVRILHAEEFGVPQERRRVFIVATRLGWEDSLFPPGTHGPCKKPAGKKGSVQGSYLHRWQPTGSTLSLVTVWDAIGDLAETPVGTEATKYTAPPATLSQKRARGRLRRVCNHVAHTLSPLMLERISYVPEGGNWRNIPRDQLPDGMKRARLSDHTKRYGRLSRDGLSATILTKCDPHWGSYIHPLLNRTITVREAARIQSFRDSFQFVGPFVSKHYEQVGNAVPPLVARSLGNALKAHVIARFATAAEREPLSNVIPLPAFAAPAATRSDNMRAIRGRRNRTTELRLRALLTRNAIAGWSLARRPELGSPDFWFLEAKVLVFVDGCFWHACPNCGHIPKSNTAYWTAKIARNQARDRRATVELASQGYTVVRIWECQLRDMPAECVDRIRRAVLAQAQEAVAAV